LAGADNQGNKLLPYVKYITAAAVVVLAAFVIGATVLPSGTADRNVPGTTTGPGKSSLID